MISQTRHKLHTLFHYSDLWGVFVWRRLLALWGYWVGELVDCGVFVKGSERDTHATHSNCEGQIPAVQFNVSL